MNKDWIPFAVFAGIIAVCTLVFIIKGRDSGEDEPEENNDSVDEEQTQE